MCPLRSPKKRVKNKKKEPFRLCVRSGPLKKRVKNKKKKPFRFSTCAFFPRVLSPARPAPPAIGRGTSGCRFSVLVLKGFQKKKCPATITIIRGPKICLLGKKEVFCGNLFRFRFPTKSSLEDSHSARVRVAPKRCLRGKQFEL